jgi:hypothetical protein
VLHVTTMPEDVFGEELTRRLQAVDPHQWYPVGLLLEATGLVARKVGRSGLQSIGRTVFKATHQQHFLRTASTVGDLIFHLDAMYHASNRGERIGGWKVVSFQPGLALVEKTTPHRCELEEGLLMEATVALGLPVRISQTACVHEGGEICVFKAASVIKDARWQGKHPLI